MANGEIFASEVQVRQNLPDFFVHAAVIQANVFSAVV